jgi:hypothetical protein
MTKAFDHNARKYWILNVGDLKPAEIDIDYFLQLATDEPRMAQISQRDFLTQWLAEQLPDTDLTTTLGDQTTKAEQMAIEPKNRDKSTTTLLLGHEVSIAAYLADIMTRYYELNFIRKPEFMGFNGYNDGINRTVFNPFVWGDTAITQAPPVRSGDVTIHNSFKEITSNQNLARAIAWRHLNEDEQSIAQSLSPQYASAFFELVGYPIEATAAQNEKFLATDLTYLDAHNHDDVALAADIARAQAAYDTIHSLTAQYNSLQNGKWDGIMSAAPRERPVFEMPRTATTADADKPLPASWGAGDAACQRAANPPAPSNATHASTFVEQHCAVSINAAHFARKSDGNSAAHLGAHWNILADLGISGASIVYGAPGLLANQPPPQQAPSLDYDFATTTSAPATLLLHLLPTFAVDSGHRLRYAISLDGAAPIELDASGPDGHGPDTAIWSANVLRNSAIANIPLGPLAPGKHTIRLISRDPGVVYEHLVITFPGAPPAYPVPPETR